MNISVIGSGTMGSGIAQVAASNSCLVQLYDISEEALSNSKDKLQKILSRQIEKGRMTIEQVDAILERINYTSDLSTITSSDLVIEAIVENHEIKCSLFQKIEELVSQDCVIASNTSSLSITSLAACLKNPNRFIGIHFFNPAPLMKLVEIIPAIQTDKVITQNIKNTIESWSKTCVLVKDTPGFIVNKVARPFYSEALRIFEEGVTGLPPEEAFATIDWAMTEHAGFRMGPFTLMDYIGNDVNYAVTESVFKAFYFDPRYKPAFTQKRLSEAGFLGRKTKRGYYNYQEGASKAEPKKDDVLGEAIADRIIIMLINEAADTLQFNIASKEDIDLAMTKGVNYPKGLFVWADEIGLDNCVKQIDALYNTYHEDRYRCSPLLRKMASQGENFYA